MRTSGNRRGRTHGSADAVEPTRGRVVTVDNDPGRAGQATDNLASAGVTELVEQQIADAAEVLRAEASGGWTLVFLDAERPAYASYWPDLDRILAPGGLLVVDNCISHADQVAESRALIDAAPNYRSTLVRWELGCCWSARIAELAAVRRIRSAPARLRSTG